MLEVAQHASLALLSGTSSMLMSSPDVLQPDLAAQWQPLLEPQTAQVLDFDGTIPRSGDVVQYIVRAIDENRQNPALSEARQGASWAPGNAAEFAMAITSFPQRFWHYYCWALEAHPLVAKMATGVVGTVLGDALAQYSSAKAAASSQQDSQGGSEGLPQASSSIPQYDAARCARQVAYSLLVGTPLCHLWFNFLDGSVLPDAPTSAAAVLAKVALDQALMAPFGTALFFTGMKVLEGTPETVLPTLRSRLLPTLMASYMIWPLAHIINFSLVPSSQRVLYVNCIAVLWTAYMSHMVNSGSKQGDSPSAQDQGEMPSTREAAARTPVLTATRKQ